MLGHMYSTDEALSVGMIDKIVAQDELMNSAKTELERWLKIPGKKSLFVLLSKVYLKYFSDVGMARFLTKQQLRHDRVGKLLKMKEADIENFVNFVSTPAVQKGLGVYMENLKKKAQA